MLEGTMGEDGKLPRTVFAAMNRRALLKAAGATALAGAMSGLGDAAWAANASGRMLLKGGVVLSFDPKVGDFDKADVLIEGKKIVAVGPNISAGGASVIDASGTIVLPG